MKINTIVFDMGGVLLDFGAELFSRRLHVGAEGEALLRQHLLCTTDWVRLDRGTITEEEAEHHPQKNIITKALGVDYRLEPEFTAAKLKREDRLLLCTDGLTNVLPKDKMEELLTKGGFYDIPDRLVDAANADGGPDNITALLLGVEPLEVKHG